VNKEQIQTASSFRGRALVRKVRKFVQKTVADPIRKKLSSPGEFQEYAK
jgi:hypothetical protein